MNQLTECKVKEARLIRKQEQLERRTSRDRKNLNQKWWTLTFARIAMQNLQTLVGGSGCGTNESVSVATLSGAKLCKVSVEAYQSPNGQS